MKQVPRLVRSPLTGRVFILTKWTRDQTGTIIAQEKHDVTEDFKRLVAEQ